MDEIAKRGLKPSVVERELSLSNGYLATMKKRNGSLTEEVLLKFSKYLNFSLSYLIKGVEDAASNEIDKAPKRKGENSQIIEALNGQIDTLKNSLNDKQRIIDLLSEKQSSKEKKPVFRG
ncbi:hypothetical protein ABDK00_001460 [Niabella insulamsoli]|uniref:hypothetical protein n=1 Tax=Niabella insulamsoli TaxID=3144874 RepID=UPI0031FDA390